MRVNLKYLLLLLLSLTSISLLTACEAEKISLKTVEMVSQEDGSPDFRRMIKYCFDKPLGGGYYYEVSIESKDGFILEGTGVLRPAASNPDDPCILRNMNQYVNKKSPPRARDLIERYLAKGNVELVHITIWQGERKEESQKMEEKRFNNL
jgi:hypothetical protein